MFDFTSILKYAPFLLQGAGLTLLVSIASLCIGMCLGLIVALLRMSTISPIKFAAGLYIDIFRSTPLLAQLMWIFFALPIVTGITLSPFYTGTIGLGLYSGSYLAEVYRSGILAIPQGQWHASRAIGMNTAQLLRRIILPQAVWRVLPPMASMWISILRRFLSGLGSWDGGIDLQGPITWQPDAPAH